MYVYTYISMCATVHKSEDNLWTSVLFFHHVASEIEINYLGLGVSTLTTVASDWTLSS